MEVRFQDVRFLRGARCILEVPSLKFAQGRVTALLGPNGAGKSTILRLIAALERPTAGTVWLDGASASPARPTRAKVAFAFQDAVFITGTVRSNLDLALRLRDLPGEERATRIAAVAEACGIAPLLDRNAHGLSGGESQRANLARALCLQAPLTLLDEPLAGLDGPARQQLLRELPSLLRTFAATTILVTHDRDEALRLADDLVVLIEGRVRAAGVKRDVFRSPPDAETAEFLGYSVVSSLEDGLAIAPGALRIGEGDVTFDLTVEAVADLGARRELSGWIAGTRVALPLDDGAAVPGVGSVMLVSAPRTAVVRW
jgi:tungstate transport system ATP-binding protein